MRIDGADADFWIVTHGDDSGPTHGFGPFETIEEAQAWEDNGNAIGDTCVKQVLPMRAVQSVIIVTRETALEMIESQVAASQQSTKDHLN